MAPAGCGVGTQRRGTDKHTHKGRTSSRGQVGRTRREGEGDASKGVGCWLVCVLHPCVGGPRAAPPRYKEIHCSPRAALPLLRAPRALYGADWLWWVCKQARATGRLSMSVCTGAIHHKAHTERVAHCRMPPAPQHFPTPSRARGGRHWAEGWRVWPGWCEIFCKCLLAQLALMRPCCPQVANF